MLPWWMHKNPTRKQNRQRLDFVQPKLN